MKELMKNIYIANESTESGNNTWYRNNTLYDNNILYAEAQ